MKKSVKVVGLIAIYAVIAVLIGLTLAYFYQHSNFFRSLFDGSSAAPASLANGNEASIREAAQSVETMNQTAARLSFFILTAILILQAFAFVTAGAVFVGLRHSTESIPVRMKKLDNADLFLDLPLYFGLLGTVASFIVMSFNPNISRLIAYSSTLVGIIFSVILRLTLQYPLRQALICASAEDTEEELTDGTTPASTASTYASPAAPAASARPAAPASTPAPAQANLQKTPAAAAPKTVNIQKTPTASAPKTVNLQKAPVASAPKTINLQKTSAQGQAPDAHRAENATQAQNEGKEIKQ